MKELDFTLDRARVAERNAIVADFTPESIGPVVERLFEELCAGLDRAGVETTGPAVCYYDERPDGSLPAHAARISRAGS